jgi:hypothetical protein
MSTWLTPEQLARTRPAERGSARAALDDDGLATAKREYAASGEMRTNLAYGYVRTKV